MRRNYDPSRSMVRSAHLGCVYCLVCCLLSSVIRYHDRVSDVELQHYSIVQHWLYYKSNCSTVVQTPVYLTGIFYVLHLI